MGKQVKVMPYLLDILLVLPGNDLWKPRIRRVKVVEIMYQLQRFSSAAGRRIRQ